MRLRPNMRAGSLLRRLPRPQWLAGLELALIALIAVQAARLFWIWVTPVGPIGEYRGALPSAPPAAALGEFDPFFRLAPASGPLVVTSLNIKLHGVLEDRATGRGSAILALPDGSQRSFGVGEEILPGVVLESVGADHVTLRRGGAAEQVFLDQSAPAAAPDPASIPAAAPASSLPVASPDLPPATPLRLEPRTEGGRTAGIAVSPGGDGGRIFREAGFAPGDVIVAVNGRPVSSIEQAREALGGASGPQSILVERAGRQVPLRVELPR